MTKNVKSYLTKKEKEILDYLVDEAEGDEVLKMVGGLKLIRRMRKDLALTKRGKCKN